MFIECRISTFNNKIENLNIKRMMEDKIEEVKMYL